MPLSYGRSRAVPVIRYLATGEQMVLPPERYERLVALSRRGIASCGTIVLNGQPTSYVVDWSGPR